MTATAITNRGGGQQRDTKKLDVQPPPQIQQPGPLLVSDIPSINAKGKGCSVLVGMSGSAELVPSFFSGVGFSSHASSPEAIVTHEETLAQDTLASDWVYNRMLGRHRDLGEAHLQFTTHETDGKASTASILGDEAGSLLPGSMVNTIYFEMDFIEHNMRVFNKEPLVLRSKTNNLSSDIVRNDPRYQRDPMGIPQAVRELLEGTQATKFLAVGEHAMQSPVAIYLSDQPDQVVAHMAGAKVNTVPHYGVELSLVESEVSGDEFTATLAVSNLTARRVTLQVGCRGIGNLAIDGDENTAVDVEEYGEATVDIRAHRLTDTELSPLDCVLIGASNICDSMEEFISGSLILSPVPYTR